MGKKDYPEIARDYYHVDATCMWMVKNPEWFDVIVTGNMFGDIITDLGAITQGGMGIAAGGNINPEGVSMFEPIGGSAPKYTGKNVINPLGRDLRRPDDARNSGRRKGRKENRCSPSAISAPTSSNPLPQARWAIRPPRSATSSLKKWLNKL